MTDAELLQGLKSRDTAALAALVDAFADPVYRLVRRILAGAGGEQDVEECASDTFHTAWRRIEQYDPERAPLPTWLLILAKYQALERRRALLKGRSEAAEPDESLWAVPDQGPTPEEAVARAEERQEVQAALEQLAPIDRELVYRRYFLHERVDRLARALGLSRQAADNRLWRARRSLAAFLAQQLKGEVAQHER